MPTATVPETANISDLTRKSSHPIANTLRNFGYEIVSALGLHRKNVTEEKERTVEIGRTLIEAEPVEHRRKMRASTSGANSVEGAGVLLLVMGAYFTYLEVTIGGIGGGPLLIIAGGILLLIGFSSASDDNEKSFSSYGGGGYTASSSRGKITSLHREQGEPATTYRGWDRNGNFGSGLDHNWGPGGDSYAFGRREEK